MTTATIPTSAAELEEMLNDRAKMGDLLKNPKDFGQFIQNYARTVSEKDRDIADQVREQTQLALAEFLNTDKAKVPANFNPIDGTGPNGRVEKNKLYNRAAIGAQGGIDKTFTSFAELLRATNRNVDQIRGGQQLQEKLAEHRRIQNSFGETVPDAGGFLVPEQLRSDLLMVSLEQSIIRPRATVIPMESLRTSIPAVDSTTNNGSNFGGITAYWTEEGAALTESQGKFLVVQLEAKKLVLYVVYPNELVRDASAFDAFLGQALPKVIAFQEDYKFMVGSGAGEPLGFINCPASVNTTAVTGQGANTIIVENLAGMFARMLPTSIGNAVWVASIDTFPQLATLALQGSGLGSSTPVWMNNGVQGAPPISIYGRPVYFTEKCSTLGTTGDINFVDLSYYLVGDRQAMSVETSEHVAFASDKTATRVIERVDGRPWIQSAITPANGGNTLTPFVQLSSTRT